MAKTLKELQSMMVQQLRRKGFYPKDEEALLRLGEEIGGVMEAVREEKSLEELSHEMANILWQLLRYAELKGIDLKKAFLGKVVDQRKTSYQSPNTAQTL